MMTTRRRRQGPTEWQQVLLTIAFGLIIVIAGGWNYVTALFGSAICVGSLLEIREVRLTLKVRLNRLVGTDVFQMQDTNISNSNVMGNIHGDVHIHNPGVAAKREDSGQRIEREFSLAEDEYQDIKIDLTKGQTLQGEVSADGRMSVYIMSESSLHSFDNDYDFNPYWSAESVLRSTISYSTNWAKRVCLVIESEIEDEINVEVKLRVV